MQPQYEYGDESISEDSKMAVAKLMADCGIANGASYADGGTGASSGSAAQSLIDYFDYDLSINMLDRNECSAEYYEGTIQNELRQGRPRVMPMNSYATASTKRAIITLISDGMDMSMDIS